MFDQQPQSSVPTAPTPVRAAPSNSPITEGETLPPPKRSHLGRWIAIFVVLLLLVGGAAAAVYYYLTVYSVTPQKVMARMYVAMQDVSSVHADLTVAGTGTGVSHSSLYSLPGETGTVARDYTLALASVFRFDDAAKLFDGTFSFTTTADSKDVTALIAEVRSAGDTDYVQFASLMAPTIPAEFQKEIALVLNRWIVVDTNAIATSLNLDALLERLQSSEDTVEKNAAVQAVLQQYLPNTIAITETLPSEDIHGVGTYHYAYSLNKNAVGELLNALATATGASDDEFSEVRGFLGASNDVTGEMWIGKKDAMLHKITVHTSTKTKLRMTITATVLLSEYGTTFAVVAPDNATSVQDVLRELLQKASEDAKADDDGDGLVNGDEDKYETDRANTDTDGDGYTDGEEVEGGFNPKGDGKLLSGFGE